MTRAQRLLVLSQTNVDQEQSANDFQESRKVSFVLEKGPKRLVAKQIRVEFTEEELAEIEGEDDDA